MPHGTDQDGEVLFLLLAHHCCGVTLGARQVDTVGGAPDLDQALGRAAGRADSLGEGRAGALGGPAATEWADHNRTSLTALPAPGGGKPAISWSGLCAA